MGDQIGFARSSSGGWVVNLRAVRGDLLLVEDAVIKDQVGGTRQIVDDNAVEIALRVTHHHRVVNAFNRRCRSYHLGAAECRLNNIEGNNAWRKLGLIDTQSEVNRQFAIGQVAVHGGVVGTLASGIIEIKFKLRPAESHEIAAGACIDKQISDRTHINAIDINPIVPCAGDDLDPFDIEEFAKFHASAKNTLYGLAVLLLSEDIESVCEHSSDNGHGVKSGTAINLDIGILDINKGIYVNFPSVILALLRIFTVFTCYATDINGG